MPHTQYVGSSVFRLFRIGEPSLAQHGFSQPVPAESCQLFHAIAANRVVKDQGILQVDLFTDTSKLEREKSLQATMLGIKKKFGKNAVLKGTNYLEGATMRERNGQIGGHKAK